MKKIHYSIAKKRSNSKVIFGIALVILILVSIIIISRITLKKNIQLYSKSAIVMSTDNRKVLFHKNMHRQLIPGSMTKLMSMLIVFEKIHQGVLFYSDPIYISPKAAGTFASRAGLYAGEYISVDDLIKCVFLPSGSDAIIALAEHLYGTEEKFVDEMNHKVKQMGLKNTHFTNCVGLEDTNHYSSAFDIDSIAVELTSKYPEVYGYTSMSHTIIRHEDGTDLVLKNTNDMLEFDGIDGLKTGSTPNGGYSLTMTYNKNKKHLVFVVMESDTLYFRKYDCKKLLSTFQ